ncbi:MAG: type I-E CRISPR-associated protein Cas6/Cse3/CasE [Polyangiales bacterium]
MSDPLFMVRMQLDARRLTTLARERRLPLHSLDTGYFVHCVLGELFGDGSLKPFKITTSEGPTVDLLGYTTRSHEALRRHAQEFADPAIHALCRWEGLASKELPDRWEAGRALDFEVRASPTVRTHHGVEGGARHEKGREVDAYVATQWRPSGGGERPTREAVYREWFAQHFERHAGARLVHVEVAGYQRATLLRRTQGESRKGHFSERPDVTFTGTLEVIDPADFDALLRRGVGRHRAFGFGMLLLRPARAG